MDLRKLRKALQRLWAVLYSATGRLAASYLAVIMVMSLTYSYVLYSTSAHELGRMPPRDLYEQQVESGDTSTGEMAGGVAARPRFDEFLRERAEEGRRVLLQRLIVINLLTLAGGAWLSYYLARRTLQPIEANVEAQVQFVSDASHELRTPLTTLQTTNEVALRNAKLSTAQAREVLRQNIDEVGKLQELTDGLLKLARQDTEALPMEQVSLQRVAGDAMNRIVAPAQAKDIAVEDKVRDIAVKAHAASLTQAVVVLLDNAIKYSRPHSTIVVEGGRRGKHAYIRVVDEGPGIRPSDLPRIFERFYRADQSRSSQHVNGHGIGLSLAKKIAGQHGGTVDVASEVGKGSKFTISLPLG